MRGMMPVESEGMWTLSDDRRSVRFNLPPVPLAGFPRPLELHVDFDAEAVDALILQLVKLRARMLPKAPKRTAH